MPLYRAQVPDIFLSRLPLLEEFAYLGNETPTTVWDKVFAVRKPKQKGSFVNMSGAVGTSFLQEKEEGSPTPEDRPYQGYDKKFLPTRYGLKIKTSDEAMADDAFSVTSQHAKALGVSNQATRETHCADILTNGFATHTSADGQYVFATGHTMPRGGTWANRLSSHVDLSYTSLQLILNLFDDMQEISGMALMFTPKQIIYPTELQFVVNEILRSQYRPDNANMAANAVDNLFPLTPMKWPVYLTDADAFFVSSGPNPNGLVLIEWEPFNVKSDYDVDEGVGLTVAKTRYSYGCFMPHGIAASAGA